MIVLTDLAGTDAVRWYLSKLSVVIPGRELCCLPFFCLAGIVLMVYGTMPSELENYLDGTGNVSQTRQGATACLLGEIERVEPDGDGIRLFVSHTMAEISQEDTFSESLSAGTILVSLPDTDFTEQAMEYVPGSRIRVQGWLYLFPRATNPGQFDTKLYYYGKNVHGGMKAEQISVIRESRRPLQKELLWIRMKLFDSLEQVCQPREKGVFQAILLGASREVTEETKKLYQAGGIAHLLSISGLHISCLAMVLYQAIRRYSGSFLFAMGSVLFFLISYGIIVGSTASALRAMIMFGCFLGANVTGRKYDLLSGAGLAAILILVWYPMQIYQSGFWMSFLAVAGIGVVYPAVSAFTGCTGKVLNSLLFSWSVQITLLPVILYNNYVCSSYSVLLNLLVVPFAAYLLFSAVTGALGGLVCKALGIFFAGTGHYILNWYDTVCRWMLTLPKASMIMGKPAWWQIGIYYGLFLLAVFWMAHQGKWKEQEDSLMKPKERQRLVRRKAVRFVPVLLLSVVLFAAIQHNRDGKLHLAMLDVGQGECLCMHLPDGSNVLIDGGSTDVKNVGTYRIEPYLLSEGISHIDLLVLTHSDADHCNGILELLESERITVGEIYLSRMADEAAWEELFSYTDQLGIPIRYAVSGDRVLFGEMQIDCLHPGKDEITGEDNDNSVVLKVTYGTFSAVLTGDISMDAEDFLAETGEVTLLKAAHHGSKYSTSEELLSVCNPDMVFISCGAGNSYGHPHEELLKRLENADCDWYVTAEKGALFIETDGKKTDVHTFLSE